MPPKGRRGRRKRYDVARWVLLPVRLPEEVSRALQIECLYTRKKQAELLRDLLEVHLENKGILKVIRSKGEGGGMVRSYQVKEPVKP